MKKWIWVLLFFILIGCSTKFPTKVQNPPKGQEPVESKEVSVTLDNYGPAPDLNNEVWLNTDEPLRLANLRGKVVLLEMWTFG